MLRRPSSDNLHTQEKDPFKAVSKEDVRQLYLQISRIPEAYKKLKGGSRYEATKLVVSLMKMVSSSSGDKQFKADRLKSVAYDIYTDKYACETSAVATIHSQERKALLATHSGPGMFNVQPVKNVEELIAEIERLTELQVRSDAENRQLVLLRQLHKISESEGRVIHYSELDGYRQIALKYLELIKLLEKVVFKAQADKGTEETKVLPTQFSVMPAKEETVRVPMSLRDLFTVMNNEPNDHHFIRLAASILKDVYSHENKGTLLGIALFDNYLHNTTYGKREAYATLEVPETYHLKSIEAIRSRSFKG